MTPDYSYNHRLIMIDKRVRETIESYLPYFFKLGNIFTEQFMYYAVDQVEENNELPLNRVMDQKKRLFTVRCSSGDGCRFRLDFQEEEGDGGLKGFRLVAVCPVHYCYQPYLEKAVIRDRKKLIIAMREQIIRFLEARLPPTGIQISKCSSTSPNAVLSHIAVVYSQYPNFLYRTLGKRNQARLRKLFEWQVEHLRKAILAKRRGEKETFSGLESDSPPSSDSDLTPANM